MEMQLLIAFGDENASPVRLFIWFFAFSFLQSQSSRVFVRSFFFKKKKKLLNNTKVELCRKNK